MGQRELKKREENERMKQDIMRRLEKPVIARVRATTLASCVLVLHDKFGFGKKRLEKFCGEVTDMYDSIHGEFLSFEDVKKAIYDELGIDFDKAEEYLLKKYNGGEGSDT